MNRILALIVSIAISTMSCNTESKTALQDLDLTLYELPITIKAPVEPVIKNTKIGYIKDLSITKGDDYNIQIFASDVRTNNVQNIKEELVQEVEAQIYYKDMIEDFEDGFIYKTSVDSIDSYGFRHIVIRGDNEIIFQQGLAGTYSLDAVKNMHDAVQQN